MQKRVLLRMTYGALGIALTVALTLTAFALAGRNLSNTAGSADVRLVGEDVRAPHNAHHGHDRSSGQGHPRAAGQRPVTPPASPTVAGATAGTGAGEGSSSNTGGDDHAGVDAPGADHDHEQDDD